MRKLLSLLDVVKTRMQQFPEKYTKGVLAAASDIVSTEGVGFLLAGLGPTVVGYGTYSLKSITMHRPNSLRNGFSW